MSAAVAVAMPARRTRTARRLRKAMGATEWRVWEQLRARRVDGWKFRRQHPIGPYFVDFCCLEARLVVEVDGPVHDADTRWANDQRRTAWLQSQGYFVRSINVEDIDEDIADVVDSIRADLHDRQRGRPAGNTGENWIHAAHRGRRRLG